jgi:hypothetical protein
MIDVSSVADLSSVRRDEPACIPPGDYELEYVNFYTGIIHGGSKLAIRFRVVTMGAYFHVGLARYYHVQKVGKKGYFKAGWHSDLVREYTRIIGVRPQRRDRIPLTRYKGLYIIGRVQTVVRDRKQRELPEPSHYSVVSELVKIKQ